MLILDTVVKGDMFIHNNSGMPFGCLDDDLVEEEGLVKLLSKTNQEVTIGLDTLVSEFKFFQRGEGRAYSFVMMGEEYE